MSKEQERAELHRTIWQIANDLRGSVDGWDFKNYVLGFLFYRFISEDLTAHFNREEAEAGNTDFDYATDVADEEIDEEIRKQTIDEKGYFIYPSELFKNVTAHAEGPEKAQQVAFYGQEVNITTYNLCRINMFLHHVPFNMFDIQLGDTLIEPKHLADEPFDAIVSNPPYSTRWAGDTNPLLINDDRFAPAGVLAPNTKADLAFTMHMLHHLSTTGTAAIVEFPGVLYRGGKEQKIRQYLVEHNFVDTVIQLPSNLFFGVGIATCIIVLKKSKADNSVLFIDAGEECVKDGNKNKLTDDNIQSIFDLFANREDVAYKAMLVGCKDILANDSNLSVSSYVEKEDKREKIDIDVLNAEIAELNKEITSLAHELDEIVNGNICIDDLIKMHCPEGVEKVPLWEITAWDKKFNAVDKSMQKKIIKYNCLLAKELDDIIDESGDIRILYTTEDIAYTTEEKAKGKISEGEVVAIPWGGNPTVKYYNGRFVTGDNRIATSLDKERLNNKFLYYWMLGQLDVISTFYRGAGIQHPSMFSVLTIEIPLPPLTIQQEIISVLDSFTTFIDKMKKETVLRQKQYEYYREQLLTFE